MIVGFLDGIERVVQVDVRFGAGESDGKRIGDLGERRGIDNFERLTLKIVVLLEDPTTYHRALVGKHDAVEIGVDGDGLLLTGADGRSGRRGGRAWLRGRLRFRDLGRGRGFRLFRRFLRRHVLRARGSNRGHEIGRDQQQQHDQTECQQETHLHGHFALAARYFGGYGIRHLN